MNCIVCGESSGGLIGSKGGIKVSYCKNHADDCVENGMTCYCIGI